MTKQNNNRKKILILFLILSIVLSICACDKDTENDEQQTNNDSVKPEQESGKPEQESNSQAKSYEEIMKGGTYMLHYKGIITFEGQSFDAEVTFATNGEDTSIYNVMTDMVAHILVKDGVTYQIDDVNKTYFPIYEADGTENVLDTSDLEPSSTGTAEVYNKQLPYKEYTDGDETTRFYFDGDNLYAISTSSPESESLMLVLELTSEVPADMLELPEGYEEAEEYSE